MQRDRFLGRDEIGRDRIESLPDEACAVYVSFGSLGVSHALSFWKFAGWYVCRTFPIIASGLVREERVVM